MKRSVFVLLFSFFKYGKTPPITGDAYLDRLIFTKIINFFSKNCGRDFYSFFKNTKPTVTKNTKQINPMASRYPNVEHVLSNYGPAIVEIVESKSNYANKLNRLFDIGVIDFCTKENFIKQFARKEK